MAAMKTFSVTGAVTDGVSGITNIVGAMMGGESANSDGLIKDVSNFVKKGMAK